MLLVAKEILSNSVALAYRHTLLYSLQIKKKSSVKPTVYGMILSYRFRYSLGISLKLNSKRRYKAANEDISVAIMSISTSAIIRFIGILRKLLSFFIKAVLPLQTSIALSI